MEQRAVVTRADSGIGEMISITHPVIKKFCYLWGADFKVLEPKDYPVSRHYRILQIADILQVYDRVLSIDSDVLITPNCVKNPFDVVPYEKIGSVYEDVGSRTRKRQELIAKAQEKFGDVGWRTGYVNTGFFMVSKCHASIFKPIDGELWDGFGFDDIHLGWQIHKHGFPIYDLHPKWNTMTMFCEGWNRADRFKSFVIHYAGKGIFEKGKYKNRLDQIKHDYGVMYAKG